MKKVAESSVNRTTKTCCWVVRPASVGISPIYCGKPVGYSYVEDEDRSRIRNYNVFCDKHQAIVDAEGEDA